MNPKRLLAAAFAATGLFLAFPPGAASANDITAASADCQQWTASWAHFPEQQNVRLDVSLTYPSGTTATGQAYTYGESNGNASGPAPTQENGQVLVEVRWHLATDHLATRTVTVECLPDEPPTTTTTTAPVPPTEPPPPPATITSTPAPTLPVGTPEGPTLALTGVSPAAKAAVGIACLFGGLGLLYWTARRRIA